MTQAVLFGITITLTATLVMLGSLAIFSALWRPKRKPEISFSATDQDVVFIFRDHELIDCSDPARALLNVLAPAAQANGAASDLSIVFEYLCVRFPNIQHNLAALAQSGGLEIPSSAGDGLVLSARFHKGLIQLRLRDTSDEGALLAIDRLSHEALQNELKTLRSIARNLPTLVWQSDMYGNITWANAAYIQALQGIEGADLALAWPLPDLFAHSDTQAEGRLAYEKQGQTHWFAHSQITDGALATHFATPIDAAVQSETARRETLQTLTRTFACLPIGLALFDADRRLQVFNPALVDLTGLDTLFLAGRPSFEHVLYALRETRMLPEPKNFNSWRNDILAMEKAAEDGEYAEEWCLDDGRTYLVTGRPQANGAIAVFIQDITTEATLTRSFRAEIETAHRVIDKLGLGVIVFNLGGQVLLANEEYVQLWQTDPCADLADKGLKQALAHWSKTCEPTPFWARLAEFMSSGKIQDKISGTIALRTGRLVNVAADRLRGGHIMLTFHDQTWAAADDRRHLMLQSEILRRPDLASQCSIPDGHDPQAETLVLPRKHRSARHVGTRIRA